MLVNTYSDKLFSFLFMTKYNLKMTAGTLKAILGIPELFSADVFDSVELIFNNESTEEEESSSEVNNGTFSEIKISPFS